MNSLECRRSDVARHRANAAEADQEGAQDRSVAEDLVRVEERVQQVGVGDGVRRGARVHGCDYAAEACSERDEEAMPTLESKTVVGVSDLFQAVCYHYDTMCCVLYYGSAALAA